MSRRERTLLGQVNSSNAEEEDDYVEHWKCSQPIVTYKQVVNLNVSFSSTDDEPHKISNVIGLLFIFISSFSYIYLSSYFPLYTLILPQVFPSCWARILDKFPSGNIFFPPMVFLACYILTTITNLRQLHLYVVIITWKTLKERH